MIFIDLFITICVRSPSPKNERKRTRSPSEESASAPEKTRLSVKRRKENVKIPLHTRWVVVVVVVTGQTVYTLMICYNIVVPSRWSPGTEKPCEAVVEELYDPNHGTKCLLIRYDSEETGVLRADGGTQDILFHLNQLWLFENESWIQWREVHRPPLQCR